MKGKAGILGVLVGLALAAAMLAGTSQAQVYLQNGSSDAAWPATFSIYLDNAPSDAARLAEYAIYLQVAPSDAATPAPLVEGPIYLHYARSDATGGGAADALAASASGFDWGDAFIGAGVAIGTIVLLALGAATVRRHGGHGRGGLATGH